MFYTNSSLLCNLLRTNSQNLNNHKPSCHMILQINCSLSYFVKHQVPHSSLSVVSCSSCHESLHDCWTRPDSLRFWSKLSVLQAAWHPPVQREGNLQIEVVGLARTMGQIFKQSFFSSIDVIDRHLAWHCAEEMVGWSRFSTE